MIVEKLFKLNNGSYIFTGNIKAIRYSVVRGYLDEQEKYAVSVITKDGMSFDCYFQTGNDARQYADFLADLVNNPPTE